MNYYLDSVRKTSTRFVYNLSNDLSDTASSIYDSYSSYDEIRPSQENTHPFSIKALKGMQSFEVFKILNSYPHPKVFVIEKEISDLFYRCIASITELKSFNVKKFYYLDEAFIHEKNHHYVYLLRPSFSNINALMNVFDEGKTGKALAEHKEKPPVDGNIHTAYFIPTEFLTILMKQGGYYERFKYIGDLNLHFFPIADRLFSLETSQLNKVAECISQLQKIYGPIPNIQSSGKNAHKLAKLIKEIPRFAFMGDSEITRITLIDRQKDLITPCLTPQTFEAVIDEQIGIVGQVTELEPEWISPELHKAFNVKSTKIPINLDHEIFLALRDTPLPDLNPAFDRLRDKYKNTVDKSAIRQKSNQELKADIQASREHISNMNQLAICRNIASRVVDTHNKQQHLRDLEATLVLGLDPENALDAIKNLISIEPLHTILKLFSLYSQIHGEIEDYDNLTKAMTKAYGPHQKIKTLKKTDYRDKNRIYHLNQPTKKFKDISHFYNGYSPLSCRRIELLLRSPLEVPHDGLELILFLGGCTRAEASACQLISQKALICTTSLLTSTAFLPKNTH